MNLIPRKIKYQHNEYIWRKNANSQDTQGIEWIFVYLHTLFWEQETRPMGEQIKKNQHKQQHKKKT